MKNHLLFILLLISFISCKNQTKLKFISEYVIKDSTIFNNTIVGGISGIDFSNNQYYMVVDDAKNARVLVGNIHINKDKIIAIELKKTIYLNDTVNSFYKNNSLDLESVFVNEEGINLVSEGSIIEGRNPSVFFMDSLGAFKEEVEIPENFKANSIGKPKHNGAFEGSTKSFNNKGFWVAMEAPLEIDGKEPTFHETQSPIRITYFDNKTKKATKQFVYQLEKIDKPAKGKVNLNGVTAILEYAKNRFFIIERIYQSGYGSYGNTVRIFKASVNEKSTNTLNIESLKKTNYTPLKKELLFDFKSIKDKLTDKIIDNIEGITFGPELSNGNRSLIVVSDDNFQAYGKQLNQFILLELIEK
jgi:hypothetical protein